MASCLTSFLFWPSWGSSRFSVKCFVVRDGWDGFLLELLYAQHLVLCVGSIKEVMGKCEKGRKH